MITKEDIQTIWEHHLRVHSGLATKELKDLAFQLLKERDEALIEIKELEKTIAGLMSGMGLYKYRDAIDEALLKIEEQKKIIDKLSI